MITSFFILMILGILEILFAYSLIAAVIFIILCGILLLILTCLLCTFLPIFICIVLIVVFSIGCIANCNLLVLAPISIIGFLITCGCIILFSVLTLSISIIRFLIIFGCILFFICILSLIIQAISIISTLLFIFIIITFCIIVITIIICFILSFCLEVIACLLCGQIPYLPFDFIRDWKFMLIISLFSNRVNFLTTSYIDNCKSIMEKLK